MGERACVALPSARSLRRLAPQGHHGPGRVRVQAAHPSSLQLRGHRPPRLGQSPGRRPGQPGPEHRAPHDLHPLPSALRRPVHGQLSQLTPRPRQLDYDLLHDPHTLRVHSQPQLRLSPQLLQRSRSSGHKRDHCLLLSDSGVHLGLEQA